VKIGSSSLVRRESRLRVFVQVLGMCPVLAVTNTARNALAMGLATLFVLTLSSIVVSTLRRFVPREVRIATYILVIATFVTVVDYLIKAVSLDLHRALGAFISLIVVNCLILGRAEAFASRNGVARSALAPGVHLEAGAQDRGLVESRVSSPDYS